MVKHGHESSTSLYDSAFPQEPCQHEHGFLIVMHAGGPGMSSYIKSSQMLRTYFVVGNECKRKVHHQGKVHACHCHHHYCSQHCGI